MPDEPEITLEIEPDRDADSRTLTVPIARLRWVLFGLGVLLALFSVILGSWWYFAARSHDAGRLAAEVTKLEDDLSRMDQLAARLAEIEQSYEALRSLFAPPDGTGSAPILPPALGRSGPPSTASRNDPTGPPSSWPLTERGFLTQSLLEGSGSGEDHPGIDIAVARGSYIRAAGAGTVAEIGDDPIYGLYVIVDHGEGYRSLYAHASQIGVQRGQAVRRNQVLGLTGSSGRSTAPHLHFEILLNGEPVDPLEFVSRP